MLRPGIDAVHEIEVVVQNIRTDVREHRAEQDREKTSKIETATTAQAAPARGERGAEEHGHHAGGQGIGAGRARHSGESHQETLDEIMLRPALQTRGSAGSI